MRLYFCGLKLEFFFFEFKPVLITKKTKFSFNLHKKFHETFDSRHAITCSYIKFRTE